MAGYGRNNPGLPYPDVNSIMAGDVPTPDGTGGWKSLTPYLQGGPMSVSNGTAAAPSVSFASDGDSGMYRLSANRLGFTTGGVAALYINSDGAVIAVDSAAGDPLNLGSGTGPGTFISGYNRAYRTINAARNGTIRLLIANSQDEIAIGSDGAEGGPNASIVLRTTQTEFVRGGTIRMAVTASGVTTSGAFTHTGSTFGVLNHSAASQQTVTGSRGGNAALASLLTALAAYGLVVDGSTA